MIEWYSFSPVDTLFFRGSESMEKGSDHFADTLFPPSTETIIGALRTHYLFEHGIPFHKYNRSVFKDDRVTGAIGRSDDEIEKLPWSLIGPLIEKNEELYVPAPFTWFADKEQQDEYEKSDSRDTKKLEIIKAKKTESSLVYLDSDFLWIYSNSGEVKSLGGMWVNLLSLRGKIPVKILSPNDIYAGELRTGIALAGEKKRVREGHLFSMKHLRLHQGMSMVFGITGTLDIPESGTLYLGGERRFGRYRKKEVDFPNDSEPNDSEKDGLYLSLGPLDGTKEGVADSLVATGKISYMGGWNMRTGFHKPLKGYYPAGTVLSRKINENCIAMEENNG